jgi:hypothetical protein
MSLYNATRGHACVDVNLSAFLTLKVAEDGWTALRFLRLYQLKSKQLYVIIQIYELFCKIEKSYEVSIG